ncbi:MAG: beta-lactamase family protein [Phycisphaerales bacterium]|nr:beta-lactamase family protein [Phycisphaerales bacterium]
MTSTRYSGSVRVTLGLISCTAIAFGGVATASGAPAPEFCEVTQLALGALQGQNVTTPIPGFELLLMKDGQVVYHRSFGAWSLNRPANADSATKTISGAVIASLLDSSPQPFTLDTRLSQYLPSFTGDKAAVTVRQAFSHTSGITRGSLTLSNTTITLQQAAATIGGLPLEFAPGSTFAYGGSSMRAAGAAAEIAGGAPWNSLFASRIATPLNLSVTRYVLASPTNPRIAGGCESNAVEFSRMMEMLRRGGLHGTTRVISEASVNAMFTRQSPLGVPIDNTPLPGSSDYGIGVWLDQRDPSGNLVGALAAGARGFCSWIDFDDGMVGCFSTDVSSTGNVLNLVYLFRDAAQREIRNLPCSPADIASDIGLPFTGCYSQITNNGVTEGDYNAFFAGFFNAQPTCDIAFDDGTPLPPFGTSAGSPNNGVTEADYNCFFSRYFDGCGG